MKEMERQSVYVFPCVYFGEGGGGEGGGGRGGGDFMDERYCKELTLCSYVCLFSTYNVDFLLQSVELQNLLSPWLTALMW